MSFTHYRRMRNALFIALCTVLCSIGSVVIANPVNTSLDKAVAFLEARGQESLVQGLRSLERVASLSQHERDVREFAQLVAALSTLSEKSARHEVVYAKEQLQKLLAHGPMVRTEPSEFQSLMRRYVQSVEEGLQPEDFREANIMVRALHRAMHASVQQKVTTGVIIAALTAAAALGLHWRNKRAERIRRRDLRQREFDLSNTPPVSARPPAVRRDPDGGAAGGADGGADGGEGSKSEDADDTSLRGRSRRRGAAGAFPASSAPSAASAGAQGGQGDGSLDHLADFFVTVSGGGVGGAAGDPGAQEGPASPALSAVSAVGGATATEQQDVGVDSDGEDESGAARGGSRRGDDGEQEDVGGDASGRERDAARQALLAAIRGPVALRPVAQVASATGGVGGVAGDSGAQEGPVSPAPSATDGGAAATEQEDVGGDASGREEDVARQALLAAIRGPVALRPVAQVASATGGVGGAAGDPGAQEGPASPALSAVSAVGGATATEQQDVGVDSDGEDESGAARGGSRRGDDGEQEDVGGDASGREEDVARQALLAAIRGSVTLRPVAQVASAIGAAGGVAGESGAQEGPVSPAPSATDGGATATEQEDVGGDASGREEDVARQALLAAIRGPVTLRPVAQAAVASPVSATGDAGGVPATQAARSRSAQRARPDSRGSTQRRVGSASPSSKRGRTGDARRRRKRARARAAARAAKAAKAAAERADQ